jgi:hypothetical protein
MLVQSHQKKRERNMFRTLYNAGHRAAVNSLPKLFWSKTMSAEDKKINSGFVGVALGNALETAAIVGIGLTAAAALIAGLATPAGLSVGAFVTMGLFGTALAGMGTFGKGMMDGGDQNAGGIVSMGRDLRKDMVKSLWKDLRRLGQPVEPEAASAFKADATAVRDFSASVSGTAAAAPVAKPATPPVRAPENK